MRSWRVEHGQNVTQKTSRYLPAKYNPGTLPLNLYEEECDCSIRLKDLNYSFDSAVQSCCSSSSKTIHFRLGMIVCIKSKHLKTSKLKETVFVDQNGHIVPCIGSIFQKRCGFDRQIQRRTEEVIAGKDMLCLVKNTSIR